MVGLGDGWEGFGVGVFLGVAQGALAGFVAQVGAAEMVANTTGHFAQLAEGRGVAGAVLALPAAGLFEPKTMVGEQHGLAGFLVPAG